MEHQDDEQRQSFGHHIARKLNFNAPLLTTRRPAAKVGCLSISSSSQRLPSTSDRVPFCWEQAPGKPKEYVERCDGGDDGAAATPRLTLPPGWWRPPIQTRRNSRHHHRNDHDCNDNIDGDDDNDDNSSGSGYVLSDAEDVFSLSEAIDIVEKAEKAHKFSDELRLEQLKLYDNDEEERSNGNYNRSPNFMIERFLPDATALAASSVLNRHAFSPQRVATFSPPKGCGLDVLIPWRTKHHHQLCGVKSPVRDGGRSLGSKSSAKQKKRHRLEPI